MSSKRQATDNPDSRPAIRPKLDFSGICPPGTKFIDDLTDVEHSASDAACFKSGFTSEAYRVIHGTDLMETVLPVLLTTLATSCDRIDQRYKQKQAVLELFSAHPFIVDLLKESWEAGAGFRTLRVLGILRVKASTNAPDRSQAATMNPWERKFQGEAAEALLQTIKDYFNPPIPIYSRHSVIINSSGTGKSRMVDELAKQIIIVPICLRDKGETGYPPPDVVLQNWLALDEQTVLESNQVPDQAENHQQAKKMPDSQQFLRNKGYALVYALLRVTLDALRNIQSRDISLETEDEVIDNQKQVAQIFRQKMTEGQSYSEVNNYRKWFHAEVVKMGNSYLHQVHRTPSYMVEATGEAANNVWKLEDIAAGIVSLLDPKSLLSSEAGTQQRPLIILSFDESQKLTDSKPGTASTIFSEICRTLRHILSKPIFTLFISTTGNFHQFSLHPFYESSGSLADRQLEALPPITETGLDQLAQHVDEGVSLRQVIKTEFMCHLGRPLFGSRWDAGDKDHLLEFARMKLLGGEKVLNSDCILACIAARLPLKFRPFTAEQRTVERKQVEKHMRVCVTATAGFQGMLTVAPSEPILAEAAIHAIHAHQVSSAFYLADYLDIWGIDCGERGELVAMLLVMQARDEAAADQRIITVNEFMKALLPEVHHATLAHLMPTEYTKGTNKPFTETFEESKMWFNHFIEVDGYDSINIRSLWKLAVRGGAILCRNNQPGVDIVIPIVFEGERLEAKSMTVLLIQVKNSPNVGPTTQASLIDTMNPFLVGIFAKGDPALPVIRMVFSLASEKTQVNILQRKSTRDRDGTGFTAFDFWMAGLFPDTFPVIGEGEVSSYRRLLDLSVNTTRAYDREERNLKRYLIPQPLTKSRGFLRRQMNPATQTDSCFFDSYLETEPEDFDYDRGCDEYDDSGSDDEMK